MHLADVSALKLVFYIEFKDLPQISQTWLHTHIISTFKREGQEGHNEGQSRRHNAIKQSNNND